jgi:hypothetical protein
VSPWLVYILLSLVCKENMNAAWCTCHAPCVQTNCRAVYLAAEEAVLVLVSTQHDLTYVRILRHMSTTRAMLDAIRPGPSGHASILCCHHLPAQASLLVYCCKVLLL